MKFLRAVGFLVARFCVSALFLATALRSLLNWQETERQVVSILYDWQSSFHISDPTQEFFAYLIPAAPLLLVLGTLLLLVGGLFVLLGFREKWGAFFLILFLVPTTILYHPFWFFDGGERELQATLFLKNLALFGSLVLFLLQTKESFAEESSEFAAFQS